MQPERRQTLQSLIWLHEPLEQISERLTDFERDFDGETIVVEATAVQTILLRYLRTDISAQELESWANLIECREDLEFEAAFSEQIEMIIHQLATPEINNSINSDLCLNFLDALGTTPSDSLIQDLAVRSELVHVCHMIKSNRIELIYGCRKLIRLSHCLAKTDPKLFLMFVGVASECDDYPDHDKKKLFSQEYLDQVSHKTKRYETNVREAVLDACNTIIREFGCKFDCDEKTVT
ncbi:hypothetical protein [Thalassospira alkalitolerans]|uniref:Uncharacterized protein n=1 Tax=Thalassospira alkalitolerans TaxID=1293890 RepID=A0A1Y2LDF6_9PROT|nr:hypothetical protein [Thalassospira alkalitolerans]OSQ48876.1 hypothetical protein TALK_08110 [Thalassospira alkalitolerans]